MLNFNFKAFAIAFMLTFLLGMTAICADFDAKIIFGTVASCLYSAMLTAFLMKGK